MTQLVRASLARRQRLIPRQHNSLVKVLNAVNAIHVVHGEGDAVQTLAAHDAREAVGVIGFARGAQDAIEDGLAAHTALLQRVLRIGICRQSETDEAECERANILFINSRREMTDVRLSNVKFAKSRLPSNPLRRAASRRRCRKEVRAAPYLFGEKRNHKETQTQRVRTQIAIDGLRTRDRNQRSLTSCTHGMSCR